MNIKQLKEKGIKSTLFFCAAFSIVVVLSIIGYLLYMGYPEIIKTFLRGFNGFYDPFVGNGHVVFAAAAGTLYIASGATVLAVLVGLPCAIYMAEFADMRIRNLTKTSLEVLDGFPSIVIGLIGYQLLVYPSTSSTFTYFLHNQFGWKGSLGCDFFAWLILLIMSFPVIATISEDALRAVPQDLREASLGVGATKWQTTREVLIPTAMPRILTSILLALAAAMGEMVALYWVLAGTVTPSLFNSPITILNPFVNAQTLSILMETTYVGTQDSTSSPGAGVYALGFILFAIIGIVNIAARAVISRQNKTVSE